MSKQNKRPSLDQIHRLLDSICVWANAVLIQGERVLKNSDNEQQSSPLSHVTRKMDEHFFLTAAKQLLSYMEKSNAVPGFKEKWGKANVFSPANKKGNTLLNQIRNAREHGAGNFMDGGKGQKGYMFSDGFITASADSTIIFDNVTVKTNDGIVHYDKAYKLGNRIDLYPVMEDARGVIKAVNETHLTLFPQTYPEGGMGK